MWPTADGPTPREARAPPHHRTTPAAAARPERVLPPGGAAAAAASASRRVCCFLFSGGALSALSALACSEKFERTRHVVSHSGRAVYEWDQTLEEVNAYVPAPPGVRACHLDCQFGCASLRLGLAGNPPYMQVSLRRAGRRRRRLTRSAA